jgi:hypothetical protein
VTALDDLMALRDSLRKDLDRIKEHEIDALPAASRREADERRRILADVETSILRFEGKTDGSDKDGES